MTDAEWIALFNQHINSMVERGLYHWNCDGAKIIRAQVDLNISIVQPTIDALEARVAQLERDLLAASAGSAAPTTGGKPV